ncbi:acyl-CoA dehydrogenase family protein [Acetobacter suratthaniensis]|uniref:Acyl-CoA dehydrogenase family protein n=1 Tax=Acetobacter suratthaniensis TaxID=1502841 RepID=A0ABS3LKW0_9PROT|nr:acyl-CoA dehydrogenase family protein [Acetobacter suratthaniensis]MBO1327780.1 acyl-CoA dehydrogenase family protein [Acetobacter suratthaniensis]MCX2565762.1 acyl-CoA dehydrogenase family protein [Acetobacter suratthaniensis]
MDTSVLGALVPAYVWPEPLRQRIDTLYEVIDRVVAQGAAEADRVGRYPVATINALKACGLMAAAIPTTHGGWGLTQAQSQEVLFRLAIADPSVAQICKVHDDLVRELFTFADDATCHRLGQDIVSRCLIIGQAIAEPGARADEFGHVIATPVQGGHSLSGRKIYATGAIGADLIAVTSYDAACHAMRFDLIPRDAPGLTIQEDWNAMGQRATDSGTVILDHVRTIPGLVVPKENQSPPDWASLRYQNGFSVILVGIGVAALRHAADFVSSQARPWISVQGQRASDDPMTRRLFGEIGAELAGAVALVRDAANRLDLRAAGAISRAQVAMAVYAARSVASRVSLRASSDSMASMGARGAGRAIGFDRYWRDARTLSLHDPVDWKHEEIGHHLLTGWQPEASLYR